MIEFMQRMGIDPEDFEWEELALCAYIGAEDKSMPEIFHSEADKSPKIAAQAKEICAACPVRDICREEGINNKEFGIWGGEKIQ